MSSTTDASGGADTVELRDLGPHDMPEAIAVLARGMQDNPLHLVAYGPDPDRRRRCHARLLRSFFTAVSTQRPLGALRDGTLVGVTGIAPSHTCRPTGAQRLRMLPGLIGLGPRTAAHVTRWVSTWAHRDPDEAHVHLGPLAVDAHLQGHGIGSRIMREHIDRLDRSHQTGYLETDKPDNVGFYERFGYVVVGEAPVLGVPNWFMRREPRPGDDHETASDKRTSPWTQR